MTPMHEAGDCSQALPGAALHPRGAAVPHEDASQWQSWIEGLRLYMNHLAAGSHLPPLIRSLHRSFTQLHEKELLQLYGSRGEAQATPLDGLKAARCHSTDDVKCGRTAVDAPPNAMVPTRPAGSHSLLAVHAAQSFLSAITWALLFSVESEEAQNAATHLFFSQATLHARLIVEQPHPCGATSATAPSGSVAGPWPDGDKTTAHQRPPRAPERLGLLSLAGPPSSRRKLPLHPGGGVAAAEAHQAPSVALRRLLLCDKVTATVARNHLKQGDAATAHEVLEYVPRTSATTAAGISIFARTGQWHLALEWLQSAPPEKWTDLDVSAAVRSMYQAALLERRHRRPPQRAAVAAPLAMQTSTSLPSGKDANEFHGAESLSSLWVMAMKVLTESMVVRARISQSAGGGWHPYRWKTVAPINDLLGLLGLARQSDQACSLVESAFVFAGSQEHPGIGHAEAAPSRHAPPDPVDLTYSAFELLDVGDYYSNTRDPGALVVEVSDFLSPSSPVSLASCGQHNIAVDAGGSSCSAREVLARNHFPAPNAVTVTALCHAMRSRWASALRCVSAICQRYGVVVERDSEALLQVLRVCSSGRRWMEATRLLQKWEGLLPTPGGPRDSRERRPENDVDGRRCLRADICLQLLYDFQCARKPQLASHMLQRHLLSKHHSPDILSRAHNSMLQSAGELREVQHWQHVISSKGLWLENESLAHMVEAYAKEGNWLSALSYLQHLLQDDKRKYFHVPTAREHDAVQYALACSQKQPRHLETGLDLHRGTGIGAPWRTSVSLFAAMCDLGVPISEVAFQSAVKVCFAQGASAQAQKLFTLMMKRGVHR